MWRQDQLRRLICEKKLKRKKMEIIKYNNVLWF